MKRPEAGSASIAMLGAMSGFLPRPQLQTHGLDDGAPAAPDSQVAPQERTIANSAFVICTEVNFTCRQIF